MFKNLMDFWKGKDFLTEVLAEFGKMVDMTHSMYDTAAKTLIEYKRDEANKKMIYSHDKRVNELEKDIRKRIIEHLAINPSVDAPTCLVLMSVVKDIERVGDYTKNLYEIVEMLQKPLKEEYKEKYLTTLMQKLNEQFDFTKKAFIDSDKTLAEKVMTMEGFIIHHADSYIKELTQSDLEMNTAVCLALSVRYLKRIAAHLANTASSVLMPVSDIDFYYKNNKNVSH